MSTKKKTAQIKELVTPKKVEPVKVKTKKRSKAKAAIKPAKKLVEQKKKLTPETPHRSFRRTRRRDYERSLALPGYWAFTVYVFGVLRLHKTLFLKLTAAYAVISAAVVGFVSQGTYSQLSELVRQSGGELLGGNASQLGEAGLLLMVGISGGFSPELNQAQQLMSGFFILIIWLTTVWLLRATLAGKSPRLRDGLYNSGAPIVPTLLLSLLLLVQLLPAAIAAIGISAAMPTGLISQGVEAMIFWAAIILLMLLSLYWATSTVIALVVATLPGMYPLNALKSAHELVVGRRLRVALRVVWLAFITIVAWILIMLPIILFDSWIKGMSGVIDWLPLVPIALLLLSSASVVWSSSYIYLLYRKVVDDDAAAA